MILTANPIFPVSSVATGNTPHCLSVWTEGSSVRKKQQDDRSRLPLFLYIHSFFLCVFRIKSWECDDYSVQRHGHDTTGNSPSSSGNPLIHRTPFMPPISNSFPECLGNESPIINPLCSTPLSADSSLISRMLVRSCRGVL